MPDYKNHQQTLCADVEVSGIGVHTGHPASVTLRQADPDTGVVFVRTDPRTGDDVEIPASYKSVSNTQLATILGDPSGAFVATVEHLMAAIRATGLDNVFIDIDGPEVPVMDGSSIRFVEAIRSAGLKKQHADRAYVRVLKKVRFEEGRSFAEIAPADCFSLDVTIEYEGEMIGVQNYSGVLSEKMFMNDLMRARTFGFMKDVDQLYKMGFAKGSSLENSVVIDGDRVLNPEGVRYPDEFVRHKALDAVGDLALAGLPLLGAFRSWRGGHRINFGLVSALMSDPSAWELTSAPRAAASRRAAEAPAVPQAAVLAPEAS